jgi:hypothetical protein
MFARSFQAQELEKVMTGLEVMAENRADRKRTVVKSKRTVVKTPTRLYLRNQKRY